MPARFRGTSETEESDLPRRGGHGPGGMSALQEFAALVERYAIEERTEMKLAAYGQKALG